MNPRPLDYETNELTTALPRYFGSFRTPGREVQRLTPYHWISTKSPNGFIALCLGTMPNRRRTFTDGCL